MSDDQRWTVPGTEGRHDEPAPPAEPQSAPPTEAPQYGQYAPPPPQYGQPQYGQPQYGQNPTPPPSPPAQPQDGQYAPPPAQPQYGQPQYPPPQAQPQYGQPPYAPPQYGQPTYPQQPYGQPQYPPPGNGTPAYAQYGAQFAPPGAPEGWTPPPKPGLIPLRPLGFGTLLGAPFQVLRRNPKATFGSGLIIQAAVIIVTALFFVGLTVFLIGRSLNAVGDDADVIAAGNVALGLLGTLVVAAFTLFASALLQGVLVVEVARGTLGEKRRLGELWKAAFKRILPLTLWLLILFAAALIGMAIVIGIIVLGAVSGSGGGIAIAILVSVLLGTGFLVLACWLGTKTSMVPSIIVLEKKGVIAAIRRSWTLTRGYFWRTFGTIALVVVILYFASQIISTPFSLLIGIVPGLIDPTGTGSGIVAVIVVYVVFLAFTTAISAISSVVQAAVIAVIYIDLRMRKEGLDVELTRFVESAQSTDEEGRWPDPYLPRTGA
ncbi:hypothetical protein ACFJGV_05395 [Cnuibacter sp. UC19_7]|uniref:hypothetical protein n=1 Tax=Cnuibacter sp. UC19_7 TaxID=3350166 RepID=UPI00366BE12A